MMDFVLEAWVSGIIEGKKIQWMMGKREPWQPGEKLKLLFAGYNGTRNTGSDVRVQEMLRQIRRVLGEENLALSVMSQNLEWSRAYFGDARQVFLPDIYPPFLFREVRKHHGVVACEGSMFKSKFADALTTMFIGALGIAAEVWPQGAHRCRLGRRDARAGCLSNQPVLVAGHAIHSEISGACMPRRLQGKPLPHDLFPQIGIRCGC